MEVTDVGAGGGVSTSGTSKGGSGGGASGAGGAGAGTSAGVVPTPVVSVTSGQWVAPGDRLGQAAAFSAVGGGCYVRGAHVHASAVGVCTLGAAPGGLTVTVAAPHATGPIVPEVGSIVTAKVTRITRQVANVEIVAVNEETLKDRFSGVVRRENMRAEEIDRVEVAKSMRPGDIIRAEVVSLGDARSYYLTTAKTHLGVVFARGPAGQAMIPISWQQMQCPVTKTKEYRKAAKVDTSR